MTGFSRALSLFPRATSAEKYHLGLRHPIGHLPSSRSTFYQRYQMERSNLEVYINELYVDENVPSCSNSSNSSSSSIGFDIPNILNFHDFLTQLAFISYGYSCLRVVNLRPGNRLLAFPAPSGTQWERGVPPRGIRNS